MKHSKSLRLVSISIIFILTTFAASSATQVNSNSVETESIRSPLSQLTLESVTNFTGNDLKDVSNLFFSSTAYVVQANNGDDIVFQLDNSSGVRKDFLTLDNSALSVALGVPLSVGSNQINNLADPTDPQDAATMSWVNANDDVETDTNASTECSTGEVLTGSGCVSRYTSSSDGDSALGNEGANSLSFDTGTGTLSLGRVNQGSLTQNLDGRYVTSDTNTQLDDQPAQSNVDLNENQIVSADTGSYSGLGGYSKVLLNDSSGNNWNWLTIKGPAEATGGDQQWYFDNYPEYFHDVPGWSHGEIIPGNRFVVEANNNNIGSIPTGGTQGTYYEVGCQSCNAHFIVQRVGPQKSIDDAGIFEVLKVFKGRGKDIDSVNQIYELNGAKQRSSGMRMGGNIDMKNNVVDNADVRANQGLTIPVGTDAY